MGLHVGPRLVVQNPWLRRGELGGGHLFKLSVCCLKEPGRCQSTPDSSHSGHTVSYLDQLLQSTSPAVYSEQAAPQLAQQLGQALGLDVYARSIVASNGLICCMGHRADEKLLCVAGMGGAPGLDGQRKQIEVDGRSLLATMAPLDEGAAAWIRELLPFTAPQTLGLKRSLGCGDRLGLATPGHVRAVRGTGVLPVFAQQSIREMSRTQRTPQQVIDSATWGVLQEGWTEPWGADADHLKTTDDIDVCAAAGFIMFTIDPGDHVNDAADALDEGQLAQQFQELPWSTLESSAEACCRHYVARSLDISAEVRLRFSSTALFRAGVKYGQAIAHTVKTYQHLVDRIGDRPFELEVSVDETGTPTSVEEHFYIANELRRLGVEWVSLAPRFVGEFEKGVDYQGSLEDFEQTFIQHVAIAQHFGPYKISLHSGSDKFSVYPIAAEHAGELVHVKTAGTSYLEALRTIANVDAELMREILDFARGRYDEDKASYHVSGEISKVPAPSELEDDELAGVLDTFDGRQVLHVTYGSVLTEEQAGQPVFKGPILDALKRHEETHYEIVARHLRRHAEPFRR